MKASGFIAGWTAGALVGYVEIAAKLQGHDLKMFIGGTICAAGILIPIGVAAWLIDREEVK